MYRNHAGELAAICWLFRNFDVKLMTPNHFKLYHEAEKQAVTAAKRVVIDKLPRRPSISLFLLTVSLVFFNLIPPSVTLAEAGQTQVANVSEQAKVACLTPTGGVR